MVNTQPSSDGFDRPTRRSIRLRNFDYSQARAYFVTICAVRRSCIFAKLEDGRVRLSPIGEIVQAGWYDIPSHFPSVQVHAIEERARRAVPLHGARTVAFQKPVPGSVPTILRSYKSAVSRHVRETLGKQVARVWQSNYFERFLPDGEFSNASRYIFENSMRWRLDKEYPNATERS
jgi:putative transposase